MTHCLVNDHITDHLVFVLVSTEWDMMCSSIDSPSNYEIRSIIRFLLAKIMNAVEIHRELCATVYGRNVRVNEM
jgi:hypothetical protein